MGLVGRKGPVLDGLDVVWERADAILPHEVPQILHLPPEEVTLLRLQLEARLPVPLEDRGEVGKVARQVPGMDDGVVEVGQRHVSRHPVEDESHEAAVGGGSVAETKGKFSVLEATPRRGEGRLWPVVLPDGHHVECA